MSDGGVRIRSATAADARLMAALDPQAARRAALLAELLPLGHSWIAEAEGSPLGYALVSRRFFSRPFVELLFVDPAGRRQGVGIALMAACEAAHDGDVLFTTTNQSNAPMQALLAKAGYRPSGVILNLDPGDAELVYVKFRDRPGDAVAGDA